VGAENSHGEPDKEVWKTVMYNNNSNDKCQKRAKPFWNELVSSKHSVSTTNRFSPLSNPVSDEHVFTQKFLNKGYLFKD
jgi:hypothetical protein